MTAGLPQQVSKMVSKKSVFSIALTEDSYSTKAKRQYLINSILDRSDRRSSALNVAASELAAQNVRGPMANASTSGTLPEPVQDTEEQAQTPAVRSQISLLLPNSPDKPRMFT